MLKKTKKVFDKIVLGTGFCHSPDKNSETFKATVKVKENKGNISLTTKELGIPTKTLMNWQNPEENPAKLLIKAF